jgi:hypothetical protein
MRKDVLLYLMLEYLLTPLIFTVNLLTSFAYFYTKLTISPESCFVHTIGKQSERSQ